MAQYCCDMYVKLEEMRLSYIACNQSKLKHDTHRGLADAVVANEHEDAGSYCHSYLLV